MRSNAYCGNLLWQSSLTLQAPDLLSVGSSNREIAEEMGISEDAVKNHFRRINEKLGTKDRVEALSVALRRGLVRAG